MKRKPRYRVRRAGLSYEDPQSLTEMLVVLRAKLKRAGGPYRIKRPKLEFGPRKMLFQVMGVLAWNLPRAKVGDVWKVEARAGKDNPVAFSVRAIPAPVGLAESTPPWAGTYLSNVDERLKRVARVAHAFDPGVDCLGAKVCKLVSGTSTWSQHAYGRAIDLAHRLPLPVGFDMTRQDMLYDFLVNNREELQAAQIIHRDRQWNSWYGFEPYTGQYHTHVHISLLPWGEGHPPGC